MKNFCILLILLFIQVSVHSQQSEYKEYSYSELFRMIEEEQDSLFVLEKAEIILDSLIDQRFWRKSWDSDSIRPADIPITIDKSLLFKNVQFDTKGIFNNINFNGEISFENSTYYRFYYCNFNSSINVEFDNNLVYNSSRIIFSNSNFYDEISMIVGDLEDQEAYLQINFEKNVVNFPLSTHFWFRHSNGLLYIEGNTFHSENPIQITAAGPNSDLNNRNIFMYNNTFTGKGPVRLFVHECSTVLIRRNTFNSYVLFGIPEILNSYEIQWPDFKNRIINSNSILNATVEDIAIPKKWEDRFSFEYADTLFTDFRISNEFIFNQEMRIRGNLVDHYRKNRNSPWANDVYIEMKDLETNRLNYLNIQDPNFRNYFKWKVNQFLRLFSDYGTEPSKAIIFSLYVIVFFAFIYLFFPNSWDSHGKNRIIDRYTFFIKYMKQPSGIHEVYMEEKKGELLSYNKFKSFIESSRHEVPRFFIYTALPLYKWAVSGTRISSALLKRIDIMKGTWSDLPTKRRGLKGVLLVGAFIIAILYDITIKILNALMLSINTFTTLGFGEIPIKGIARYLAIIQGFIGWFMLTIFSVSLISQLLN